MQEEIIQNEDIENKRDLPIAVEVPEVTIHKIYLNGTYNSYIDGDNVQHLEVG